MNHVLNNLQIEQKIMRIAHEILENTTEIETIYLGGICGNGSVLVNKFHQILTKNSKLKVIPFHIDLDKDEPLSKAITLDIDAAKLNRSFVVLVDDVVNSGKTMQFALMKILESNPQTIKTVALVDRTHRRYPIKCDFVGLTLSTTLKDRVEVAFDDNDSYAYLT